MLNRQARTRVGLLNWVSLRRRANDLLQRWSVDVAPDALAGELTVE